MNAPLTLAILLATGCGGLSPLGEGLATDSGDTGSSEVVVGSLSATPGNISFGAVELGSSATEELVLKNVGSDSIIVKEPLVTGDYGFDVDTTTLGFPMELSSGTEQVMTVTFSPTEETDLTGQIILRVDGEDETATVELTGTGGVDVGGDDGGGDDGGDDGGAGTFSVSPLSIDFGIVDIGDTAAETVYLNNDTEDDILITDLTSSDSDFLISGEVSPPQVLSAGTEKYITVAYSPSSESVTNATITVETDSSDYLETDISVTGEGYQPCTICAPVITVETGGDDDHSVGLVDLACSTSTTLTIQNEGDEPLEVTDVDVNNDSISTCGTFTASWGGKTTLDPWDTTTVDLSFTATEFCIEFAYSSLDQNMMHITSNDPAEPDYAIELTASVTCLY